MQQPNQSIGAYLIEFERLLDRLEPGMSIQTRVDYLIEKISDPEIKKMLIFHMPEFTSFKQATSLVTRLESATRVSRGMQLTDSVKPSLPPVAKVLAIEDPVALLQQKIDKLTAHVKKLESANRGGRSTQPPPGVTWRWTSDNRPICHNCNEAGHTWRGCPKPKSKTAATFPSPAHQTNIITHTHVPTVDPNELWMPPEFRDPPSTNFIAFAPNAFASNVLIVHENVHDTVQMVDDWSSLFEETAQVETVLPSALDNAGLYPTNTVNAHSVAHSGNTHSIVTLDNKIVPKQPVHHYYQRRARRAGRHLRIIAR